MLQIILMIYDTCWTSNPIFRCVTQHIQLKNILHQTSAHALCSEESQINAQTFRLIYALSLCLADITALLVMRICCSHIPNMKLEVVLRM
jgi:hypothetical protein